MGPSCYRDVNGKRPSTAAGTGNPPTGRRPEPPSPVLLEPQPGPQPFANASVLGHFDDVADLFDHLVHLLGVRSLVQVVAALNAVGDDGLDRQRRLEPADMFVHQVDVQQMGAEPGWGLDPQR